MIKPIIPHMETVIEWIGITVKCRFGTINETCLHLF
jgi:hypothetical protein